MLCFRTKLILVSLRIVIVDSVLIIVHSLSRLAVIRKFNGMQK